MRINALILIFCTALVQPRGNFGYNILLSLPVASKSNHYLFTTIARELVRANHSVTLISGFEASYSHENFRHINVLDDVDPEEENVFAMRDVSRSLEMFLASILSTGDKMWNKKEIREVWEKRNSFDVFITATNLNIISLPFLLNFTGPFILVSCPGVEFVAMKHAGNWLPPSVMADIHLPLDDSMTFWERCYNFVSLLYHYHYTWFMFVKPQDEFVKELFPGISDSQSYFSNASLTFVNGDAALDSPVALLPNQVEIGTINAKPPMPLDEELEEFVSGAGGDGVVYFSLGSFAKSEDMPVRAKAAFTEAFSRLPQRVVWKYEGEDLDLPENVLTRPWLPQQDILGHQNTRLFISHCGILSVHEAKYHGVPVLALPVAFDQPRNAARLVRKELGLSLSWDTLTAEQIIESINILINDTSYRKRMKTLSRVLRDQKESPAERAVWWVEYVIRHQGAPHLQYPGKRLHFLQYVCADVILFLTLSFYLVYRVMKKLAVVLFDFCSWRMTKPKQKIA